MISVDFEKVDLLRQLAENLVLGEKKVKMNTIVFLNFNKFQNPKKQNPNNTHNQMSRVNLVLL